MILSKGTFNVDAVENGIRYCAYSTDLRCGALLEIMLQSISSIHFLMIKHVDVGCFK